MTEFKFKFKFELLMSPPLCDDNYCSRFTNQLAVVYTALSQSYSNNAVSLKNT